MRLWGWVIAGIVALGALATCRIWFDGIEYSKGERVGIVTKFSKKGLFFETWEGDMTIFVEGSNGIPVKSGDWSFSVADESVAKKVEAATSAGKRVVLRYVQRLARGSALADTSYDVVSVN